MVQEGKIESAGSILAEDKIEKVKYAGELLTSSAEGIKSANHLLNKDAEEDGKLNNGDALDSTLISKSDVVDSGNVPEPNSYLEHSFSYRMSHPERGCFLIFNQETFDPHLGLEKRVGTSKDATNLFHTAKHMGFEYVQIFQDSTKNDIFDWLNAVSKASHSVYDSFACAILTHGDDDDLLYAKDASFKLSDCIDLFTAEKCPTLAGKPKLFFIQACRGEKRDAGFALSVQQLSYPGRGIGLSKKLPNQADFLIAYSTSPGFMSWRNKAHGSWFVQALHHCFSRYAKTKEVMQIMTRVNKMVAYNFESYSNEIDNGFKQVPSVTSRLTAEVYFYKPNLDAVVQQCPVCYAQLHPRDSLSSNQDTPCSSKTPIETIEQPETEKQSLKRSKSFGGWLRKSLRRGRRTNR